MPSRVADAESVHPPGARHRLLRRTEMIDTPDDDPDANGYRTTPGCAARSIHGRPCAGPPPREQVAKAPAPE